MMCEHPIFVRPLGNIAQVHDMYYLQIQSNIWLYNTPISDKKIRNVNSDHNNLFLRHP